jgi:hypothetical protein
MGYSGNNVYPYENGLHQTTEGYRYELGGGERYELGGGTGLVNVNDTRYIMGDRPVALEYAGEDASGNPLYRYTYPTTTGSTQIGEIEPVPNEVINSKYYEGGVPRPSLDVSKTNLGRKAFNKAKVVVKNRFAKYNEPSSQRRMRLELSDRQYIEAKYARRADEARRAYDRSQIVYGHKKPIATYKTVRRFD